MGEIIERQAELAELLNVECYPITLDEVNLSKYSKVPMTDIASIGAGLSSIPEALRTTTSTFSTSAKNIYEEVKGITLKEASDGSGLLRGFEMNPSGKGIKVQGAFKPVEGLNTTVTSVAPINPATMCMAVALMSIDKKMNQIIEIDKKILQRIVVEEKAELRNDLTILKEIAEDYRFNWNNDRFLNAQYKLAADINRNAGKQVIMYRELIEDKLRKKSLIQGDFSVNKLIGEAASDFGEYQLATYVYAYSSFIKVMLQGNFDPAYLDEVSSRLRNNSIAYRELYTKAYNFLLEKADNTVESHTIDALSAVGEFLGKAAAHVPRFDQLAVDDALIEGSEKLSGFGDDKVNKQLKRLVRLRCSYSKPFIDNISQINRIFNEPMKVLFDNKNLYLPVE